MNVIYYAFGGLRIHEGSIDLSAVEGIPHLKENNGDAAIDIDSRKKTISFEQDGITNSYNNVVFKVDHDLEGIQFKFKLLPYGGCEVRSSYEFALKDIFFMSLKNPDDVHKRNNEKEIIISNGYTY